MFSRVTLRRAWRTVLTASVFLASSLSTAAQLGGCPVFPADSIWNTPIDQLPLDARSSAYIVSNGGPTVRLHPDFGTVYNGAPNGIPYVIVPATQALVPIVLEPYGSEADPGPYPIPANAPIEGGPASDGDRHVLVLQQGSCKLYELFRAFPLAGGAWQGFGAVFDLKSNALRTAGYTSADAAGLPILPGLVKYDEVQAALATDGIIHHALRFTVPNTRREYVWPARHFASFSTDPNRPPMGQRFRLKASTNIDVYPGTSTPVSPTNKVILRTLKKYGMFLADNGGSFFVSGAPDPRWSDDDLHLLKQYRAGDFEAVDSSSLMANANSAQVRSNSTLSWAGISPWRVRWKQTTTLTIRLNQAAPAAGVVINLKSALPSVLSVPATVTIPAGSSQVNVPLVAGAVGVYTSVQVTATVGSVTKLTGASVFPSDYPANSASFVGVDSTTQGDWPGRYGLQGYRIVGSTAELRAPHTVVAPSSALALTWAKPAAERRAPYTSAAATQRVAAAWHSPTTLLIDVIMTDSAARAVSLYFLDWDATRSQVVEVFDIETGRLIETRPVTAFSNGVYFSWRVAGQVRFRLKRVAGANAVASGVFVGSP